MIVAFPEDKSKVTATLLLFPFTLNTQGTLLYTFPQRNLCTHTHTNTHRHTFTHTLPDGRGAVVMSGVTTGNAITAQTE